MVFCCCCHCCLRLFCCLGTVSLSLPVELPVLCVLWVSCAWCMFHMSWWLCCFCCLFLLIVLVDPNTCVVGDQGHDFVRSAQGFLSRNGLLFVSTYRRCGNWRPCNDNCCCGINCVVILMMPSQCSCHVCRQGCLVVSRRNVAMAPLLAFKVFVLQGFGASCWEWHW